MKINQITLIPLTLRLKEAFRTNHGTTAERPLLLIEMKMSNGITGYGEVQAFADSSYAPQSQAIALAELQDGLPALIKRSWQTPTDLQRQLTRFTSFARAGVEMALWDAYGKLVHQPLAQLLGQPASAVPVSVALGIQAKDQRTIRLADEELQAGYQRLKIKTDNLAVAQRLIKKLKIAFPNQLISFDPNAAWPVSKQTISVLKELAADGLSMIEEPFHNASLAEYASVQAQLPQLKISLDESINSLTNIQNAVRAQSAAAFTLKPSKLGGITPTMQAIQYITNTPYLPWIGGMLGSGLGRAVDLALAAQLPQPIFPADIADSDHYFELEPINESFTVTNGSLPVPTGSGVGVTLNWDAINQLQTGANITFN
ncbi:enolase C-terminal domain-like protein [Fructilactobacillus cliffordii]|uniref:O-succinylbenzoate synthase n=1 Tax=Fructilactobacillus cliffordii TaxID=2940299 RepID=A0A9Q8ZV62_9LACO|nr:enolase C-terminal domain-like protein [Fructilactobacillus cliffordii]USS89096.1 o-succinylbenzoate synthase [Fructilactobacillus cliffordii]